MKYLFSSESITEGHPDKVCDGISDSILDACLEQDPKSRVAVETLVTKDFVCVSGELTTTANVNFEEVVRKKIEEIGYNDPELGFSDKSEIKIKIHEQSPDISQGVSIGSGDFKELGAGDQGIMFGFATNETESYMPLPIDLANRLSKQLSMVRKKGVIKELLPDGKTQVTVEYVDGKPLRVSTIVVASHHKECDMNELRNQIKEKIIIPIAGDLIDENTRILINATGKFLLGGPSADTGLTGRKIIADTYGGQGRHGGGAFSGKDPSKVDRSAAYAARYIAKNIVAAGLAENCEVQLAYCIGYAEPLNIFLDCNNTEKISLELLEELIRKHFPLKPAQIIKELNLNQPIYHKTSAYGHFGKDDLPWEQLDKVKILKEETGL
jgi:S-adenosylmethionine synthetase